MSRRYSVIAKKSLTCGGVSSHVRAELDLHNDAYAVLQGQDDVSHTMPNGTEAPGLRAHPADRLSFIHLGMKTHSPDISKVVCPNEHIHELCVVNLRRRKVCSILDSF